MTLCVLGGEEMGTVHSLLERRGKDLPAIAPAYAGYLCHQPDPARLEQQMFSVSGPVTIVWRSWTCEFATLQARFSSRWQL